MRAGAEKNKNLHGQFVYAAMVRLPGGGERIVELRFDDDQADPSRRAHFKDLKVRKADALNVAGLDESKRSSPPGSNSLSDSMLLRMVDFVKDGHSGDLLFKPVENALAEKQTPGKAVKDSSASAAPNPAQSKNDTPGGGKSQALFSVAPSVDSPEFKKWFGDSKVVDADGKPLVVYHGTANDFSAFKDSFIGQNHRESIGGFFFGSAAFASGYGRNGSVMPVFLSIRNPLTLDEILFGLEETEESAFKDPVNYLSDLFDAQPQTVIDYAIQEGKDGIFWKRGDDIFAVAFRPEQIKSVYNRGTWAAGSPDIRFSVEPGRVVDLMHSIAAVVPGIEFSREKWDALFPENKVKTPLGEMKIGENQFVRLSEKGRQDDLGMMRSTLTDPMLIVEEPDGAWAFMKAFADGKKNRRFLSVAVSIDGQRQPLEEGEAGCCHNEKGKAGL